MKRKKNVKKDLRRYPRVDIHLPAEYKIIAPEEGKSTIPFETENISIGGLMFYSYVSIRVGTNLLVHLYVDNNPIEFSAKVVWIAEWPSPGDPKKTFAVGLQYFKITPEAIAKIGEATSRVVLLQPKTEQ